VHRQSHYNGSPTNRGLGVFAKDRKWARQAQERFCSVQQPGLRPSLCWSGLSALKTHPRGRPEWPPQQSEGRRPGSCEPNSFLGLTGPLPMPDNPIEAEHGCAKSQHGEARQSSRSDHLPFSQPFSVGFFLFHPHRPWQPTEPVSAPKPN